ncbi:MAG TPA: lipoate--protein ligase family protein [Longimicrobiales bacterium]|nr:lipoate--protein ligase family protein [Longimicrobiales bacterium]
MSGAAPWRLLRDDVVSPATGARNMAIDHALLESVQAGGAPVLRLYRWDPPCLSFGRNQHTLGVYDPARAAAAGIDVVRRATGGLAVLHDRELTYCVLAPLDALGGARAAYQAINRALVDGLSRLGVPVTLSAGTAARDPRSRSAEPCFQAPASGEVVAHGRKLVGSAQRCERRTLLQHGSILVDGSQADVLRLLAVPAADTEAAGAITLAELLGAAPGWQELCDVVAAGFAAVFGTGLAPDALSDPERLRADELEELYGSADWTWRK